MYESILKEAISKNDPSLLHSLDIFDNTILDIKKRLMFHDLGIESSRINKYWLLVSLNVFSTSLFKEFKKAHCISFFDKFFDKEIKKRYLEIIVSEMEIEYLRYDLIKEIHLNSKAKYSLLCVVEEDGRVQYVILDEAGMNTYDTIDLFFNYGCSKNISTQYNTDFNNKKDLVNFIKSNQIEFSDIFVGFRK